MQIRAVVALLAAVAVSAVASEGKLTPVPTAAAGPQTVAAAMQRFREVHPAPLRVAKSVNKLRRARTNVIEFESADNAFLIPAAGNVQGSNGTFFRSDVTFVNYNDTAQNVGVGFLINGKDNTNEPLTHFTIDPQTVVTIPDFVGTTLKTSGLGSLLVLAFDSTGANIDDAATIDAFSRIWTPQPGSAGTVSQSFPAVSLFDSVDNFTAIALGLRADAGFRTNIGVVNLDSVKHTWTISSVNNGKSFTMDVQPFSLSQTGVPADWAGAGGALAIAYDVPDQGFTWSAYASSVDNLTGDGWVARGTQ
ncbi:MAG TPA: hypothetical protein VG323_10655 [Thermoanaerobaculia bacterium]|nr:hypothetical protein [Thermoanaerobaculia bacterium]